MSAEKTETEWQLLQEAAVSLNLKVGLVVVITNARDATKDRMVVCKLIKRMMQKNTLPSYSTTNGKQIAPVVLTAECLSSACRFTGCHESDIWILCISENSLYPAVHLQDLNRLLYSNLPSLDSKMGILNPL